MIRSTTIKSSEKTLEVIKRMIAMKNEHREVIVKRIKESRKK